MPDWKPLQLDYIKDPVFLIYMTLLFILFLVIIARWQFWQHWSLFFKQAKYLGISYREWYVWYVYQLYKQQFKEYPIDVVTPLHKAELDKKRPGTVSADPDKVHLDRIFLPPRLSHIREDSTLSNLTIFEALEQRQEQRVLITGEPGAGKTILSRYLVHCALAPNHKPACHAISDRPAHRWIPLFINMQSAPAMELEDGKDAEYFMRWLVVTSGFSEIINRTHIPWIFRNLIKDKKDEHSNLDAVMVAARVLQRLLATGSLLLILDGLEHVVNKDALRDFAERHFVSNRNLLVVTARPGEVINFIHWHRLELEPLTKNTYKKKLFLKKHGYDQDRINHVVNTISQNHPLAYATDNPLVLEIYAYVIGRDLSGFQSLPSRFDLQRKCVNELLEKLPPQLGRDSDDRKNETLYILGFLAYRMLTKKAVTFKQAELEEAIKHYADEREKLLNSEVFQNDLLRTNLFYPIDRLSLRQKRSWFAKFFFGERFVWQIQTKEWMFLHFSFQEFLAAHYVESILSRSSLSPVFEEAHIYERIYDKSWQEIVIRYILRQENMPVWIRNLLDDPAPFYKQVIDAELIALISEHFSLDEQRLLATDSGVKWEDLPGSETLSAKAYELVGYMDRRGQRDRLVEQIKLKRPGIDLSQKSPTSQSNDKRTHSLHFLCLLARVLHDYQIGSRSELTDSSVREIFDETIRKLVLQILSKLADYPLEELKTLPPDYGHAVGQLFVKADWQRVNEQLQGDDIELKKKAAVFLGKLGTARAIVILIRGLKNEQTAPFVVHPLQELIIQVTRPLLRRVPRLSPVGQQNAIQVLSVADEIFVLEQLLELLPNRDSQPDLEKTALAILNQHQLWEVDDQIFRRIWNNASPDEKSFIFKLFVEAEDENVLATLQKFLDGSAPKSERMSLTILSAKAVRAEKLSPTFEHMLKNFLLSSQLDDRLYALYILSAMGRPSGVDTLFGLLEASTPSNRKQVIDSLLKLPNFRVLGQSEPNPCVVNVYEGVDYEVNKETAWYFSEAVLERFLDEEEYLFLRVKARRSLKRLRFDTNLKTSY